METELPLLAKTIALTEKKVAMALDDIIKLSKKNTNVNKGNKPRREKNKNQNFNGAAKNRTSKGQHYMNSLSAVRQGIIAKRRTYFQGNQVPVTSNSARKAATAPPLIARGRAFNAGRMNRANLSRFSAPPVPNRYVHTKFIAKRNEVDQKVENGGGKRKTLDSRFATMKEQRMSNNYGVQRLPPPWTKARRFNY